MKRLVLLFLCLLVAVGAFAGEKGPRFDIEGGAALSLYSTYVSVTPEIMYDMGLLAVGVGVKNYFGIPFHDIYTAPYALVELGWFYLGAGASFMIKAPGPGYERERFRRTRGRRRHRVHSLSYRGDSPRSHPCRTG